MPINAYTGLMGSGKSYECVASVIVPAINIGRRVVTNVDGIDSDAIRAYCNEQYGTPLSSLGHVVHCKNHEVSEPNFLPFGEEVETLCHPGDIICIDEAWRFWGTDCKLLPEHKIFFREHRHFVHPETKACCDLVLMVQDISDIHRILKVVVELNFKTTKIKSLGLNKVYRVEMWEGHKQTQKGRIKVENKKYDAKIFPLYSSYTGGTGKELQVDSRQNILKSKTLWMYAAFVIVLGGVGIKLVYDFFNPESLKANSTTNISNPVGVQSAAAPSTPRPTDTWRIAGIVKAENLVMVALVSSSGIVRYEHPSNFQGSGMLMVGEVDGQTVSTWSGSGAGGSIIPGAQ
ncbi:zonular occludens toxin domain-containing protein [Paraperlucidibaca sp.]|uniref:zonular occludens toxin domain-containing protein n=1 Tax=Paraperlucidibaca sp. TaxID=2708021 RepID=UPI0030F44987